MKPFHSFSLGLAAVAFLCSARPASVLAGQEQARPVRAFVLLGEWFGDAYFPLQKEMAARGWLQKRIGVDAEYRGCYKKERDVVLTSDILIPELKDLSAYDVLIIPSGPQFRKFKENPVVLEFLKNAHASKMLIASFCVGNFLIQAAGLVPEGAALFPDKVTLVREGLLLGPRGGGPPPDNGFESAPIQEICNAIDRELDGKSAARTPTVEGEKSLLFTSPAPPATEMKLLSVQDLEAEKSKIVATISNVIGWAKDKNLDLFYGSIANDEDYVSVTPGARVIKRFDDVKQNVPFWMSSDFKYVRHELKDLEITFARCGTVAWFYCVLDDINTFKGEPISWENARWTGVVEKRDGRWVVVAQHFSFAQE